MRDAGILTTATEIERLALRACLEANHIDFCRFFFRVVFGEKFIAAPHHHLIAELVVDPIFKGEMTRALVNIPPGYTKTMEVVIMLIARAIALYPDARFIHTSFSDPLVLDNSTQVRDIVLSPEFQALWPTAIRNDVSKKGLWRTTRGGGMLAAATRGTITGFRAGRMDKSRFTGALIGDDMLKPMDAFSASERNRVNNRILNTLRNRLAHEDVPLIFIGQRLHTDDPFGFLLRGGSGDIWDHLLLPVEIDPHAEYPADYTHGRPIPYKLPAGPLWPYKHSEREIEVLRFGDHVFKSQYMQAPDTLGGTLFKEEYFDYWDDLPNLQWRAIYADTAQKTDERNDYSVFQCWGKGVDGRAYLIDQMRGKWTAPDLEKNARAFWLKHRLQTNIATGPLRVMKVEDKSSGTGLIQSLTGGDNPIPVEGVPRNRDKVVRCHDVLPSYAARLVKHPRKAGFLREYESELKGFPDGAHDDQVDPTMDAVSDIIGVGADLMELLT